MSIAGQRRSKAADTKTGNPEESIRTNGQYDGRTFFQVERRAAGETSGREIA